MITTSQCAAAVFVSLAAVPLAQGQSSYEGPDYADHQAVITTDNCLIDPSAVIELGSQTEGVLAAVPVRRGSLVKRGDELARLDTRLEEDEVQLADQRRANDSQIRRHQARLAFLERKLDRMRSLEATDVVSFASRDEVEAEVAMTRADLDEARIALALAALEYQQAQVRLEQKILRSPLDGVVVSVDLLAGEYRHSQSPVMTLAQLSPLFVEVYLPVATYGQIAEGDRATVWPAVPGAGPQLASVLVINRVMDAASDMFGVRLALPNDDLLLPAGVRCRLAFDNGSAARSVRASVQSPLGPREGDAGSFR